MKPGQQRLLFKTIFVMTQASVLIAIPAFFFWRDKRFMLVAVGYLLLLQPFLWMMMLNRCRHCGYRMTAADLPTPQMTERIRRRPRLSDFDHCPGCGKDPFSDPGT